MKKLLEEGVSVSYKTKRHEDTAIETAVNAGRTTCLALLLNKQGEIPNPSLLMVTAARGYPDCMKLLLDHGANVHYVGRFGDTALIVAVRCHNVACVRMLLSYGISESKYIKALATAQREDHVDLIKLLTLYDLINAAAGDSICLHQDLIRS